MTTLQTDVLVVGSGTAGLTAAVVAAKHGLQVTLTEKSSRIGGTSAWSGGGCWVPCNRLMADVGLGDSREDAEAYIRGAVGSYLREDLLEAFLDNAPAMVDWMLGHTEVRFAARKPFPDARMDLPGARVGGRSLASVEYDGRQLGGWLGRLQLPLDSFNAPFGMMLAPVDVPHALDVFRKWDSFLHMGRLGARYAWDRLLHGRGTRLTMGNALVARLLKSALDAGVNVLTDCAVHSLLRDGKRVSGVTVRMNGEAASVLATRGVVLAAGGSAADPEWRRAHAPYPETHRTMVSPGNVGDGIRMAMAVGGTLCRENHSPGAFDVVSVLTLPDGRTEAALHFIRDLPKPGSVVVGRDGKRFANEANLKLGKAMLATGNVPAWLICNHQFLHRYGAGLVLPFALNLERMLRAGYIVKAATLAELAGAVGISPEGLTATVSRFNEAARTGVDEEFGRGRAPGDQALGDATVGPNPSLGPIEGGPYYALRLVIGDVGSVEGLRVQRNGQVLDEAQQPIPGLFAAGMDMNSIWAGAAVGAGLNHAHNMTFAYIAAKAIAAAG